MNEELDRVLNYDSLSEAEKLTGLSYKEDEQTRNIGLVAHLINGKEKEKLLRANDDTTFSETIGNYRRIIERIGFKQVYEEEYTNIRFETQEHIYIHYHDDGLLLTWDTFHGKRNSAHVAFNLERNNNNYPPVSCSFNDKLIMGGELDAREGIIHNLNKLRNAGKLLKPWMFHEFCNLRVSADYSEDDDFLSKENSIKLHNITMKRYNKLPGYVKDVIKTAFKEKEVK